MSVFQASAGSCFGGVALHLPNLIVARNHEYRLRGLPATAVMGTSGHAADHGPTRDAGPARVTISLMGEFVSRAGLKLEHALATFNLPVAGCICADLGSNTGGFVDCLLQRGAAKVYAIDTGYGALDWKLRKDPRVVVMERTNAMHVTLPEPVAIVTIDVAWTRQRNILPSALRMLAADGQVVSLVKPHYEADRAMLKRGILQPEHLNAVLKSVQNDIVAAGFELLAQTLSPIKGSQGNTESLVLLRPLGGII